MISGSFISSENVLQGLRRLQAETFVEGALGFGAQEVISTSVIHQAWSSRSEDILRNGIWGYAEGFVDFSVQSMDYWLKELRREYYRAGVGTWTSCKVYLYPETPTANSRPSTLRSIRARRQRRPYRSSGGRTDSVPGPQSVPENAGQHTAVDVDGVPSRRRHTTLSTTLN